MIPYIIFILSLILVLITFLMKKKLYAISLSIIAITINSYFLLKSGLFTNFFVGTRIGSFGFTVNSLNYPFLITILIVSILTLIFSSKYFEGRKINWGLFSGFFSLSSVTLIYTVLSTNLLELLIFLEVSIISVFFLILLYGKEDKERASSMFILWSQIGMSLLLASIILIGIGLNTMDIYKTYGIFNNFSSFGYAVLVFMLATIGMMIKSAQVGANTWLPKTYKESPSSVIILNSLVTGISLYIVILYFYLFNSLSYLAPIFIGWAILSMIYGGINTFSQNNMNKFLGYSSISQLGYMLLGASISFFIGLNSSVTIIPLGILASIFIYISIAFGKGILFMSVGGIEKEVEYKEDGLFKSSPIYTAFSFIGVLNVLGLPPTIGFIGEILLILSSAELIQKAGILFIPIIIGILISIAISSGYAALFFKKIYGGKKLSANLDKSLYTVTMGILSILSVILSLDPEILSSSFNNFVTFTSGNYFILPLIVFLPSLGSFLALITPSSLSQNLRGYISLATIGIASALGIYNLINILSVPHTFISTVFSFDLFSYFAFSSSLMQSIISVFVLVISFFIALYSIDYMKEDKVLRRYWGFFGFFITSMLAVVLSNNLILFLLGWEGTSLASFALISYYLDDTEKNIVGDPRKIFFGIRNVSTPSVSGIRALIFTRMADVGLIAGLGYLLFETTFSQYSGISALYPPGTSIFGSLSTFTSPFSMVILILLYIGGLCKSAQFPFTQWLITAMTGPTPVSALIHAATMVNLGAIFTFLTYPFLVYNSSLNLYTFFEFIIAISAFTAIYTSLNALVSNEQKVILANSTADQISLMILSSSIGGILTLYFHSIAYLYTGISIGILQMIAHGLYKASLFMNAGSVIHYTESRYIGEYPSLYKRLKSVFTLQLLASLNLASIPPLIGFWAHSFIAYLVSFNPYLVTLYLILEFASAIYIIRYLVRTFLWRGENMIGIDLLYKPPRYSYATFSYSNRDLHNYSKDENRLGKLMIISPGLLVAITIITGALIVGITRFMSTQMFAIKGFLSFSLSDALISLLGIVVAYLVFTRNIHIEKLNPVMDFLYSGFFIYPLLDKLGIYSMKFFNKTYETIEYNGLYTALNVKLPLMVRKFGGWAVTKVQTGILRNYVGFYIVGLIMVLIILLIII